MRKFLTSIALAALVTATAQADPGGNGKGGGNKERGNGGAQASAALNGGGKGNGGGKAENARQVERVVNRGPAGDNRAEKGRPDVPAPLRVYDNGKGNGNAGRGNDARVVTVDRPGKDVRPMVQGRITNFERVAWRDYDSRALVDGCPPGLAKKNNGCMPPGLAKQDSGWDRYDADWWGLRGLTGLSGYRYYDGNLVRLGPSGMISGYYPLLGGALAIGNVWPSAWSPTPVPQYYVDYYGLGDDYRYFDGALYRLDPETQAIETIAALLTGDTFSVGQRIPDGYGVYNVPYAYRDRYVDGPDAYYRYNDGYVYEVDPTTQLVVAAINLLT
ncbi:hypothetical protein B0I00_1777 [Novosphingobium kunmingense]|uniref:Nickel/cobalt transporter regulator n=1 Tax=Novosphingobium kunmingense TaxID=1211806 RepID=A0A2N0HKQ5_9SPHN|nr:hypothetical protein [Novosphingobium kunmingense]PKB19541.1 hypothetical protein B0I00_1777 [Novosphingobium kunmingense]